MKRKKDLRSGVDLALRGFLILVMAYSLSACSTFSQLIFKSDIQVKELWQRKTGAGTRNYYTHLIPAVTEERIYVADTAGIVTAYERKKAKRLWQKTFQDVISGGVFVGYGLVLFGTEGGDLYALNAENGKVLWKQRLSSEILSVPAANGQLVVAQTADGKLFALDQQTGAQKWMFQVSVPALSLRGTSSPQLNDEVVLCGFANGKLVALYLTTGLPIWERAISLPKGRTELDRIVDIDGDFIFEGPKAYASTYQGHVASIDVRSGRPIWQREISSSLDLASGLGNIYLIDAESHVVALDQLTGADVWEQKSLLNKKLSSPVSYGNYLVTGDEEGYLYFISQIDGKILKKIRIKGFTDNINPEAKSKARFTPTRIEPGNGLRTRVVVKDDLLYVINNSGTLRALRVGHL